MNKYEKLLRYLRKINGAIMFHENVNTGEKLITIKKDSGTIMMVVNKVSEVLKRLEKELSKIK